MFTYNNSTETYLNYWIFFFLTIPDYKKNVFNVNNLIFSWILKKVFIHTYYYFVYFNFFIVFVCTYITYIILLYVLHSCSFSLLCSIFFCFIYHIFCFCFSFGIYIYSCVLFCNFCLVRFCRLLLCFLLFYNGIKLLINNYRKWITTIKM